MFCDMSNIPRQPLAVFPDEAVVATLGAPLFSQRGQHSSIDNAGSWKHAHAFEDKICAKKIVIYVSLEMSVPKFPSQRAGRVYSDEMSLEMPSQPDALEPILP